jgi:hypothetical protein
MLLGCIVLHKEQAIHLYVLMGHTPAHIGYMAFFYKGIHIWRVYSTRRAGIAQSV